MTKIQQLARDGHLEASNKSLATCDSLLGKACIHGKQRKRPLVSATFQPLDSDHLQPGDCVLGDQLESTQPSLIPTYQGSPTTSFHSTGTLFVDHASRLLFFAPHISTGAEEAVPAKHQFELFATGFRHIIQKYHAINNGIFASKLFRAFCAQHHQQHSYCGVNAHHQNGIAKRHIRTITEQA